MSDDDLPAGAVERVRLDKWLWRARFFRTRTLAATAVSGGRVRVNGARMRKPGHALKPGDVLTISHGGRASVVCVREAGLRRGPASEARALYEDLTDQTSAHSTAEDASPDPPPAAEGGA